MAGGSETSVLEQGKGGLSVDRGGEESGFTDLGELAAFSGEESDKLWSPESLAAFTAIARNCGESALSGGAKRGTNNTQLEARYAS